MKTLVLGSEGFVGKPFCQYLRGIGKDVVGIDIKNGWSDDLRFLQLDLKDIEVVYFLAWDVGGAKYLYEDDTQLYQLNWNSRLLSNIMPQLQSSRIPFVFVSSQLAAKPDNSYGVTKRLGEVWTRLLGGSCIRLWNVYGVLESPSKRSHVVSDLVYGAVRDRRIELMTTGMEKRQFVHIDDVCRALEMAVGLEGIHDVTSCEWTSIINLAKIIADETNSRLVVGKSKSCTVQTPYSESIPNWFPVVTLRQGLLKMIDEATNG